MKEHIIILIDTSYSMNRYILNVVKSLNNFIDKLKYTSNDVYISVASFNNNLTCIVDTININLVKEFNEKQFFIWGSTALYDSICETIKSFEYNNDFHHNLFIISDGDDTVSQKYNKDSANKLCDEAISTGWNITHCSTEASELKVNSFIFDINNEDDISNIFNKMSI
jgi:uncharacterized protein YegL